MLSKIVRRLIGRPVSQKNHSQIFVEQHVELRGCMLFGPIWVGFRSYANDSMIRHNTTIGRYCSIGRRVTMGAAQHSLTRLTTHGPAFDVAGGINPNQEPARNTIGNDVWIGDNVVILSGLRIGDGAVIGAGAVVTKNVPPYAIVAGVPAKPIRMRFDSTVVEDLMNLRWWDYGDGILRGVDFDDIQVAIEQIISRRKDCKPLLPHHTELI